MLHCDPAEHNDSRSITPDPKQERRISAYLFKRMGHTGNLVSVTELHYRNDVSIIDAFLGYGDIIIVVNEPAGHVAYDALEREVAQKKPAGKITTGNPDNPQRYLERKSNEPPRPFAITR